MYPVRFKFHDEECDCSFCGNRIRVDDEALLTREETFCSYSCARSFRLSERVQKSKLSIEPAEVVVLLVAAVIVNFIFTGGVL